jgi:uridine phosphorylase
MDRLIGHDYYEFFFKGKRIGIIQSGIGAPMATLILERLIVRGVERVISTGIAGALRNEGIDPGDLVLCTKAVRNEGTSYHLPEAVKVFLPRQAISKRNRRCAQKRKKMPYHKGPTISIDGPYQFSIKEAKRLRRENVITSNMEASAIFAVAKFRKISAASLFVISDLATKNFEWPPQFHSSQVKRGFKRLFKVCAETLAR